MRRTRVRAVVFGLVLGAASSVHAYFLDEARNFEIRLHAYAGVNIATESSREGPRDPATGRELAHSPDIAPGDILSQRNFYSPEFDAKLTDYTRWTQDVPGFSLISPEEFKFHFAWWGFYDGIFDYANAKWRDALDAAPSARQSESNDIPGESFNFNDENKNPRNILGKRNRINELYLDFTKGRFFTRIGRQSIAWGESDTIILLDVINNFDLTYGAPGFFQDLEEARIPFWAMRNTIKLIDNWGSLSPGCPPSAPGPPPPRRSSTTGASARRSVWTRTATRSSSARDTRPPAGRASSRVRSSPPSTAGSRRSPVSRTRITAARSAAS